MKNQARNLQLRLPRRLGWQRKLALTLAATSAVFVLAVMGRRAGKTTIASDIAGRTALKTSQEVAWGSPTHSLSELGREKFEAMFGQSQDGFAHGALIKPTKKSPPARAELIGGGRIIWISLDRESGSLGRGVPLYVIDEAARVKERIVQEEVMATVADLGGKILAITTPRGRKNWVHKWYSKAREGNPDYAYIKGPSTENPNPNIKRFIEVARREMDDLLFRQEFLAEFIEGEGAVFRHILERATVDFWLDEPVPDRTYVIGCDVAKHQDWTVLTALDCSTGEFHGFDRFQHIDWPLIEDRIRQFQALWGGEVWLDSTGVGDPVFDHLQKANVPVVGYKFGSESKAHLVQALSAAMDTGAISYPNDEALVSELETYEYDLSPTGKFRYGAAEGSHDDIPTAMMLATYGRNNRITGVPV